MFHVFSRDCVDGCLPMAVMICFSGVWRGGGTTMEMPHDVRWMLSNIPSVSFPGWMDTDRSPLMLLKDGSHCLSVSVVYS